VRIVSDASGRAIVLQKVRVLPDVDPKSRTFAAVGAVAREAGLAPGMSVTAWVPTADEAEHLTVCVDAILRGETGSYVYVAQTGAAGAPATAVPVPVDVLFVDGARAAVRAERLAKDADVVVEGNERLWPTAPLAPSRAPEPKTR
jgi:hypothetical protein